MHCHIGENFPPLGRKLWTWKHSAFIVSKSQKREVVPSVMVHENVVRVRPVSKTHTSTFCKVGVSYFSKKYYCIIKQVILVLVTLSNFVKLTKLVKQIPRYLHIFFKVGQSSFKLV